MHHGSPLATLTCAIVLALGVALQIATLVAISPILWPALPFAEPDRLYGLVARQADDTRSRYALSGAEAHAFVAGLRNVAETAWIERWPSSHRARFDVYDPQRGARRAHGAIVSSNFFSVLGTRPLKGRLLNERDVDTAAAVISFQFWNAYYGASDEAIGQQIVLNGRPHEVVGVLPATFVPPVNGALNVRLELLDLGVWIAEDATWRASLDSLGMSYELVARLKSGVERAEMHASVERIGSQPKQSRFLNTRYTGRPLPQTMTSEAGSSAAVVLGISTLILGVACLNIVLVFTARSRQGLREVAIRISLGASRVELWRLGVARLARLVVPGLLGGVVLGRLLGHVLTGVLAIPLQTAADTTWKPEVLFTLSCVIGALVWIGALAAMFQPSIDLRTALVERSQLASPGPALGRAGRILVAGQVATVLASVALGVALLARNREAEREYARLGSVDITALLLWRVERPEDDDAALVRFQSQLQAAMASIPGVLKVGIGSTLPFVDGSGGRHVVRVARAGEPPRTFFVEGQHVDAATLRNLRVAIQHGRTFQNCDTLGSPPVAIVSESLARLAFGHANAVGERLEWHGDREIVGVAADATFGDLRSDEKAILYVPIAQEPSRRIVALVETVPGQRVSARSLETAVSAVDTRQAIDLTVSLESLRAQALRDVVVVGRGTTICALFGAGVAMLGLYALAHDTANARRHELGIRAVCGATPTNLTVLVLRSALMTGLQASLFGLPLGYGLLRVASATLIPLSQVSGSALMLAWAAILAATTSTAYLAWRLVTRGDLLVSLRGN